jgi:ABC-2 type transport system permease protein
MTNTIKSDFYKLRKSIALRLLPAAAIVATCVTAGFMFFVDNGLTVEGGEAVSSMDVFGFLPSGAGGVFAMSSISNLYAILAVVFGGLFISNEFANGTIRNALCIGKSRLGVYLSKLLSGGAMLLLTMLMSLVAFIGVFTAMYGFGDGGGFLLDTLKVFSLQFLYHLTFAAVACMLAFLVQNMVFSVAIGIFWTIISSVLTDVFTVFDGLGFLARIMPNYYITRLADNLNNSAFITQSVIASVAVIAVTAIVGCVVFKRRDIK